MPQIDPELKLQLLGCGKWREFVKYREDLKKSGMTNADAHHKAVAKFIENPPTAGWDSPQHKATGAARSRKHSEAKKAKKLEESRKSKGSVTSSPPPDVSDVSVGVGGLVVPTGPLAPLITPKLPAVDTCEKDPAPSALPEPFVKSYTGDMERLPEVCSADFEGKRASEVESVRWVADNMEIVDPKAGDCPCAAAWGLFAQCRGSMTAKSDFWKLTFPKLLPSRAQMDAEQDSAPDESKAKEVIEDLLRFGRAAEGKEEPEAESTQDKVTEDLATEPETGTDPDLPEPECVFEPGEF